MLEADAEYAAAVRAFNAGAYDTAFARAQNAARNGYARGATLIGYMLERGIGREADPDLAAIRYKEAAAASQDPAALHALGLMARDGRGGLASGEAPEYLRLAADAGRAEARVDLALLYLDGVGVPPDAAAARTIMQQTALEGVADAQFILADMMLDGVGGPVDEVQAVQWLEIAGRSGDPDAAYAAAVLLSEGVKLAARPDLAAEFARAAADAGHSQAATLMGYFSALGLGVAASPQAAAEWYATAARRGDAEGRFFYAVALAKGDGVARDPEGAFRWLVLSKASGGLPRPEDEAAREGLIAAFEKDLGPERAAVLRAEAAGTAGLRRDG